MSGGPFLYPSVTSIPGQGGVGQSERPQPKKPAGTQSEFDQALDKVTTESKGLGDPLGQIKQPLKFSAHASQRLQDRKIALDPATLAKVNDAVDKAQAKGIEDTLVLTNDAALIVSVKNRTVITAMDRSQMAGNVFTNIDGAVIV
jgi:flagellar operon protein